MVFKKGLTVRKYSWFLTFFLFVLGTVDFAQQSINIPFVSYSFGLQKMDFFHQVSVGIQGPKIRLDLQQGFGQRSFASRILLSQTGVQGAYRFAFKNSSINPYLRYAFGRLGGPFKFNYHRAEFGALYVYEWSQSTRIPFDLICSSGLGCGLEIHSQSNRHSYLDYSINVGLQYAFK